MKIIVVGGTGIIGKAIVNELAPRHEVVVASAQSGDIKVDMTSIASIEKMYEKVKNVDAVVSAAGTVHFADFADMQEQEYRVGIDNKLMGQVNLVLVGRNYLNPNGSFTLTSGILNQDPIRYGSGAAMVNGALNGFVVSAAIEMPKNMRINIVSPTVIAEAMANYAPYFRGYQPVAAAQAALAFSKSVEGLQTGQIYRVGY